VKRRCELERDDEPAVIAERRPDRDHLGRAVSTTREEDEPEAHA
jgi:hypothetical protein